ncbi:tRNA (adenosine(37)-N6)-threonylcarbamoyltransferase complex ATPase subunit type 1 TsaE [Thalassotalea sediminis]|uniref:tRNA (adenosine(37)-N6)-threonylcarbamoyltransferase complex ATPase subunit type 1 TsaE n=1 Tax=Thalassotalea sediminis TaxID=1759089 RepID=UPI00257459A1|nr:tRNA (adenosine(37)-N6)-threonylcarbamoyltransferase complex ATPase subunit type 1 TsaE [Thalassotalea sediminis]
MVVDNINIRLIDEQATVAFGNALAQAVVNELKSGIVAYLHGDLGAGKTTLTRGFVQGLGHSGKVKSPTYTLVEPYELGEWQAYHFDLYRLSDPEELEFMGIRDYFNDNACCFIEWPERGVGVLPEADISIYLQYNEEQRDVEIVAHTSKGRALLAVLGECY